MVPEVCPNCGAEIPCGAKACPQCGSDEETGWSEEALVSGLDLPEGNFNYNDFVKREFGGKTRNPVPRGLHWFWWLVAIGLVLGFFLMVF